MPDGTRLLSILDDIRALKFFESVDIRNYLIVMSQLPETLNPPSIGDINTALKSSVTDWLDKNKNMGVRAFSVKF